MLRLQSRCRNRFKALYLCLHRVQAMSVVSHCRHITLYALSIKMVVALVVGCMLGQVCIIFLTLTKRHPHGQHASHTHAGLYTSTTPRNCHCFCNGRSPPHTYGRGRQIFNHIIGHPLKMTTTKPPSIEHHSDL